MKLIERYIAGRVIMMTLSAVVPMLAVIWIIQVLGRINLVTDTGQSIGSFFKLAALMLPTVVPLVLPFGVALGTAQVLTTMNTDSELPVIDAAGASRSVVLKPVLLVALAASVISFVFDNQIEPVVRVKAKHLISAAYADLLSTVIEEKEFRRIEDGLYVQIAQRDQGRGLKGLFIVDYRNPEEQLTYYAKEGAIDPNGAVLVMTDGQVNRRTPDGNISVIHFASYAFELSSFTDSHSRPMITEIDRTIPFLLNPDPEDKFFKLFPEKFRAELHRRLTEWSFPLVYALVAFMIAGNTRSHRETGASPVAIAFAVAFALRWLSFYLSNSSVADAELTPLLYAVPIGTGIFAYIFIYQAQRLSRLRPGRFLPFSKLARIFPSRLTRGGKTG